MRTEAQKIARRAYEASKPYEATRRRYYDKNRTRLQAEARSYYARNNTQEKKEARREYARRYRIAYRAKARASQKRSQQKHRDKYLAALRNAYQCNKVHHTAVCKAWSAKHPDKVRAYKRAWAKRNPDKVRALRLKRLPELKEYGRQWAKKNAVKMREYTNRRRAIKVAATTEDCTAKIELLGHNRFCHYCCTPLTKQNRTIDHVTPLILGGKHCPDNLVAACKSCNGSKGKKLVHEWIWKEAA